MPPVDDGDDFADDADIDSSVISERDVHVDHHDVNLVDIFEHRSRVAYVITFHEEWGQADDRPRPTAPEALFTARGRGEGRYNASRRLTTA